MKRHSLVPSVGRSDVGPALQTVIGLGKPTTAVYRGTTMEILLLAVLIGLIPAAIANGKGRSFVGWWIHRATLFIIALAHALIMKPDEKTIEKRKLAQCMKKCPHCAEVIKMDAKRIILALTIAAGTLAGCAVYVPAEPGVVVMLQGGPGNGFCPPGQAKKGNC